MSDQKFQTHTKLKAKKILLCILIFTLLDSRREESRSFRAEAAPESILLKIYS
jgi:hypothetical protein